jgi:transcriptional regulator with XRE-family HTH domain
MQQKTFGEWLSDKRTAVGLTQTELAQRAGFQRAYISKLESNYRQPKTNKLTKPTVESVDRLAKALSVSVAEARLAAGYAPPASSPEYENEVQSIIARLSQGVMASGLSDLEDEDLKEAFFEDMRTIAESMLKRRLEEQNKRKVKKNGAE